LILAPERNLHNARVKTDAEQKQLICEKVKL